MHPIDQPGAARQDQDPLARALPVQRITTVYHLGAALLHAPSETTMFDLAVQSLVEQAHYASAWILTVDQAAGVLRGRAGWGVTMDAATVPLSFPLADPTVHQAIAVARTGHPFVTTDLVAQAEREGWGDLARATGIRSAAYVPFGPTAAPLGTLAVSLYRDMDPEEELTLMGLFALHLTTALERLGHDQERTAHMAALQAANQAQDRLLHTVRELATPAIPIYDGILVLPLVGHIDTGRAGQIMDTVLTSIAETHASVVILDITAVLVIDTGVANHLIQVTQAAKLLGAQCLLVGIGPEVAQTLVTLGVDLRQITTRADLQSGVAAALAQRGLQIVPLRP